MIALAFVMIAALVIIAAGVMGWQLSKLERRKNEAERDDC